MLYDFNKYGSLFLKTKTVRYFSETMLFEDAKKICQSEGGMLVTVESQETQQFLEGLLKSKGAGKWWLDVTMAQTGMQLAESKHVLRLRLSKLRYYV